MFLVEQAHWFYLVRKYCTSAALVSKQLSPNVYYDCNRTSAEIGTQPSGPLASESSHACCLDGAQAWRPMHT